MFCCSEITCNSNRSGNLPTDEIDLVRNKIADIIQELFARQMNCLVHEEARKCCLGCEIDDRSQLYHECMMTEERRFGLSTMTRRKNI